MASTGLASPETCQSSFEQSVAICLHLWPALALAVQNDWGGPDSADKRDWFAGAVVDLFPPIRSVMVSKSSQSPQLQQQQQQLQRQRQQPRQQPRQPQQPEEPDMADVETVLLQVMLDEFDVNVDDDSGMEVAAQIIRLRTQCAAGRFDELDALRRRWETGAGNGAGKASSSALDAMFKRAEDADQDTDWESGSSVDDDDEDEDEDDNNNNNNNNSAAAEDVDMAEAPPPLTHVAKKKPAPEVDDDGFIKVTRRK